VYAVLERSPWSNQQASFEQPDKLRRPAAMLATALAVSFIRLFQYARSSVEQARLLPNLLGSAVTSHGAASEPVRHRQDCTGSPAPGSVTGARRSGKANFMLGLGLYSSQSLP
jgi:hypothetical protein